MIKQVRYVQAILAFAVAAVAVGPVLGQGHMLDQDAAAALQHLYSKNSGAKALGETATGILVFPSITKMGFIIGGQAGDGVLYEKGKSTGYYNTGAASIGMQVGVQTYGYALFFLTPEDLNYLKTSNGWSLGVGPSLVVADAGFGKDASSLTGKTGVYAFIFDQKGLMAGVGLVGQKISKISK